MAPHTPAWCFPAFSATLPAMGETDRKPVVFAPKKLARKNLWNFSSRPLAIYFRPDYPSKRCGRITVIHPHHDSFRKRAATDLVRDSIRQVVDWLRPVFSGSNALEEVVSDSGVFPFWKMQTLRSE
jgi:hypothetical protein